MADVALRAATRAERLRWDPLICVEDRGNFEGIVPLQRIVCARRANHGLDGPQHAAHQHPPAFGRSPRLLSLRSTAALVS
jgi:hypothetical protein